jgi:hypothetical protein
LLDRSIRDSTMGRFLSRMSSLALAMTANRGLP